MNTQLLLPVGGLVPVPDLSIQDVVVFNSSGGKDSQAALDVVMTEARAAGVADRVVVVHADLGEMEWPGTLELAREHAAHYGLRFITVSRERNGARQSLLEQVEARGKWPDAANRYCTSDHKRGPIRTVTTSLVRECRHAGTTDRPVRVLNVLGMRAQESRIRAMRAPLRHDGGKTCPCPACQALPVAERPGGTSNTRRYVTEWLPIHDWTTEQVWERIAAAGTRPHWAYAAGMSRLSCRLCVLASKADLICSARLNPGLADEYADVEQRIGHRFRNDLSMADIIAAARPAHDSSARPAQRPYALPSVAIEQRRLDP